MKTPPIMINLLEIDHCLIKRKQMLLTMSVLIVLMLGVLAGLYYSALNNYHQQLEINKKLVQEMEKYRAIKASLDENEALTIQFNSKKDMINEIEMLQVSYINVLEELSGAVSPGVLIKEMQIETDVINITGVGSDYEEIACFISGLRMSPLFDEVKMLSSDTINEDQIKFSIEVGWGTKNNENI